MIPARIPGATRVMGAPENWDPQVHGPCGGLPILDHVDERGIPWMVSAWTPLPEEIAAIVAGGSVLLWQQGVDHPVVGLAVSKPTP